MPKVEGELKKQIQSLSKTDLEKIVMRLAAKHKEIHDFLLVNYLDTRFGEKDLFEQAKDHIQLLFSKKL